MYNLQDLMPSPKGEVFAFNYMSKLNVLNFIINNRQKKITNYYEMS